MTLFARVRTARCRASLRALARALRHVRRSSQLKPHRLPNLTAAEATERRLGRQREKAMVRALICGSLGGLGMDRLVHLAGGERFQMVGCDCGSVPPHYSQSRICRRAVHVAAVDILSRAKTRSFCLVALM